jgi:hypothetical protein
MRMARMRAMRHPDACMPGPKAPSPAPAPQIKPSLPADVLAGAAPAPADALVLAAPSAAAELRVPLTPAGKQETRRAAVPGAVGKQTRGPCGRRAAWPPPRGL